MTIPNVLVPTDLDSYSVAALRHAIEEFSYSLQTKITLLNVAPFDEIPALYPAIGSEGVQRMADEGMAHNMNRLHEFVNSNGFGNYSNIQCEVIRLEQNVAHSICSFAKKFGASHIVMATRAHSLIREALIGSVTHEILSQAPCPVTLVGPKAETTTIDPEVAARL